jgi:hypothetical protein
MVKHNIAFTVPVALLLVACPAPPGTAEESDSQSSDADDEGEASDSETQVDPSGESMSTTAPPPDTDSGSETGTGDEGTSGCGFICPPDTPPQTCDVWDQDCPMGQKCTPWANDGGNSWNSLQCVPIESEPGQPGDPCTVEGSGVSGYDTCDVSSMCWNVDVDTGEGVCAAFCQGSETQPVCDDPTTSCVIANDGVLTLCLPECDPLLQDCPDGQACYPGDAAFVCVPDASGPDLGAYGDPCAFTNACDPGLLCAGAAAVPGCTDSAQCCTEFCDLGEADPDGMCQGQADGQACLSLYEEGQAPPGSEDFGFCAIPE